MVVGPEIPRSEPTEAVDLAIVLAAGAGTRMRSALPKVLHPLAGRPLLWHTLRAVAATRPDRLVVVVGHGAEQVRAFLSRADGLPEVVLAEQPEQLGTAHAVRCALDALARQPAAAPTEPETVLVSYGDVPLLTPQTLIQVAVERRRGGHAVAVLTTAVDDPTGYGRVLRDPDGTLAAIVEERDATAEQRAITEINTGIYAFDGAALRAALPQVPRSTGGEYYLTDVVTAARSAGHSVAAVPTADASETEGINDRAQLSQAARRLNQRLIRTAQLAGVTFLDPATTWLHVDVSIGPDSVIGPGCQLESGTVIGRDCAIGPDCTLARCRVGDGARIVRTHALDSEIGAGATVGPYAYLRGGAVVGPGAHIGAHIEVKGSSIGAGAKVPHLSYIGDATIGAGSNIGAGTITANYDGVAKHRTTVGENAFVGSNSTLVAPIEIGDGSYVAGGSTITEPVGPGDLAIARGRQHTSDGWVPRRMAGTRYAAAAERARGAAGDDQPDARPVDGSAADPADPDGAAS